MSLRYWVITVVMVGCVVLQALPRVIASQNPKRPHTFVTKRMWPFLDYPMYSESYGPPVEVVEVEGMTVQLPDGSEVQVTAGYLGVGYWVWRYQTVDRMDAVTPKWADEALAALIESDRMAAKEKVARQVLVREGVWPVSARVTRKVYRVGGGALEEERVVSTVGLVDGPGPERDGGE